MKSSRTGILIIVLLACLALVLAIVGPMALRKEVGKGGGGVRAPASGINARGVVESEEEVVVGSQTAGIIRKLIVAEGDRVKAGGTVALLDPEKVAAKIAQAEAAGGEAQARLQELLAGNRPEDREMAQNRVSRADTVYRQARDEFERQERLHKKEATTLIERNRAEERMKIAAEELSEAKTNLTKMQRGERQEEIAQARAKAAQAGAEVNYYRALLGDYAITSPINGIVIERIKKEGESVDVGTPVLKLINPDRLRVRAELEESDVGKVREGDAVEVTCDAFPGKVFKGRVTKVFPYVQKREQKTFDPMASFDINTQKIHIRLDDFSGLTNGMTATVTFRK
ncbi:HlyD family secretion protein [Geobacter sp.]|uniref:HlyD family secretion protein n=1 Tax=Geobacter sp. TaxID=46610 RepID=UPI001AC04FB0|nr:HlyD family efflux transporter periplasmic adaptor subunit [Geobacter sp.]CAG0944346.1 hypothetical protein ANRL1_01706 [Anaerolineae bacterium]